MIAIEAARPQDWPGIWAIVEPVARAGETYPYPRDISAEQARPYWMAAPVAAYVARDAAAHIVGAYYLKPNQPGLGAHVCNAGYLVDAAARRQGVASALCRHSQDEARRLGYRAMQFNLVVSTNEAAVRLWRSLGFAQVGTLPGAFRHARYGEVDAYVMYKRLVD